MAPLAPLLSPSLQECRAVASGGGGWGAKAPPPQFLAEQLTLSQPGGQYAHHSTTSPLPGFSDLATALIIIRNRW